MRPAILIAALLLMRPAVAQVVLGPEDMPEAGDTMRYRNTPPAGVDLSLTGPNTLWDMSGLVVGDEGADTALPTNALPLFLRLVFANGFQYPQNVADHMVGSTGPELDLVGLMRVLSTFLGLQVGRTTHFFKNGPPGYRNVGFSLDLMGTPVPVRRAPVDMVHRFPLAFGDIDSTFSSYTLSVPSMLYMQQDQWRYSRVDGWGTLVLPGDTFEVLRVRSELYRNDTIHLDSLGFGLRFDEPLAVEYRWLAKGMDLPVLMVTTTAGLPILARFFYDPPPKPPDPSDRPLPPRFVLFPNPASDVIWIHVPEEFDGVWTIFDATGRQVGPSVVSRPGGTQRFDIQHLASGAYTLQLFDGPIAWTSRFTVY